MNGSTFFSFFFFFSFIGCRPMGECDSGYGADEECVVVDWDNDGVHDAAQYHLIFPSENGEVAYICGREDLFGYSQAGYLVGYGLSGQAWEDADNDCDDDGIDDAVDESSACGDWVTSAVPAAFWRHAGEQWRCATVSLEGPYRVNFRALNDLEDESRLEWAEVPDTSPYAWQDQFGRFSICFLYSDGEVYPPGPTTCDHTF